MLVLSRRPGESIMIGSDVVVTVLEVSGDTVRIGVRAPRHIAVHREEVFLVLQDANRDAATSSATDLSSLGGALRPPPPPPTGGSGPDGS